MRSSCNFLYLHNKLLQVAIWLGPWIVSLLRVLTMWQTLVCWSVLYLCEAVSQGVQSFGSTLCTRTWYQSVYEESLLVLIKIWNRCCWNFERVSGSWFSVHFWTMEVVPLCPSFLLGNSFRFTENYFRLFQKHQFRQIWRYNVTMTDLVF